MVGHEGKARIPGFGILQRKDTALKVHIAPGKAEDFPRTHSCMKREKGNVVNVFAPLPDCIEQCVRLVVSQKPDPLLVLPDGFFTLAAGFSPAYMPWSMAKLRTCLTTASAYRMVAGAFFASIILLLMVST